MIQSLIQKHAPWLLSLMAITIIMYADVQNLKHIAKDYKLRVDNAHAIQDQVITGLKEKMILLDKKLIRIDTEQKHKLSKETYYKDTLKDKIK